MPRSILPAIIIAVLFILLRPVQAAPLPQSTHFDDPFSYCSAVGTIAKPDARYTGPAVPATIVRSLMQAMGLPASASLDQFTRLTTWRCMNGQVYTCNYGANIPCDDQADTSRTPTAGMNDYCKANPESDFIPAYVTSHTTIFSWRCHSGSPAIIEQLTHPDAEGFIASIWYQIAPTGMLPSTGAATSPTMQLSMLATLFAVLGLMLRRWSKTASADVI